MLTIYIIHVIIYIVKGQEPLAWVNYFVAGEWCIVVSSVPFFFLYIFSI